jgi:hypothetical protein
MHPLTFWGIVLNGAGSAILIFSPMVSPFGVANRPKYPSIWKLGWGLLFIRFFLQGIAPRHPLFFAKILDAIRRIKP